MLCESRAFICEILVYIIHFFLQLFHFSCGIIGTPQMRENNPYYLRCFHLVILSVRRVNFLSILLVLSSGFIPCLEMSLGLRRYSRLFSQYCVAPDFIMVCDNTLDVVCLFSRWVVSCHNTFY